ncbi:hypothetical protein NDU88_003267 [Pleurodeles waltl]|uniref:Uncharacterized protein n=1 Tax=Pleurodeles waltl TaxID=8319 RepID=A0AAV7UD87_PLEWA|nr:hypothetical protein NDU88_003267 [Pleurodeles waltl]
MQRNPHTGDYPARGKDCSSCGKLSHLSKVCHSSLKQSLTRPKAAVQAVGSHPAAHTKSDMDDDEQEVLIQTTPRTEKWILQLKEVNITNENRQGAQNPADFLSHHAQPATPSEQKKPRA